MPSAAAPASDLSRRGFLRSAGRGAAALAAAGIASGALRAPGASAAPGSGRVQPANDPALHLLRRATYGPTPTLAAKVHSMGTTAWLEQQLRPGTIDDTACDALITSRFPHLTWTIQQANQRLDGGAWDLMFDLGVATLARACWSKRQLLEVMVDFWSNHLNVTNPSSDVWNCRHDYDRKVIRAHALGTFENLLIASAQHPAMLLYLNNAESNRDLPNENYGRELLELHTVSVDAGYSEDEMRSSVLLLTGYGIDWDTGEFHYWKDDHYTGPVKILGFSAKNGSRAGGYQLVLDYLRYLARHPMTAAHIARKLCLRFVSDTPTNGLVNALARTYVAKGTAIVPVLRQLFHSAEFAASIGDKTRRPMEDVVATVRTLGVKPDVSGRDGMEGLYWMVDGLGNAPGAWSPPDGYPDYALAWASAGGMLGTWNAHMSLAAHWWPDKLVAPDPKSFLPSPLPATHGALVQALAKRLVYRTLPTGQRNAVLSLVGRKASDPLHKQDEAVTWRLPYLLSLILDSPCHMTR
ncbi:MAG TPA: DUF1800 domain-containing protein [Actinomycetota bacterium]|jgi:uncharacterized protein (DUF1800 family)